MDVAIKIKRNKDNVKFKARTPRFLVTLVVKDTEKAEKLIKLLPPSMHPPWCASANRLPDSPQAPVHQVGLSTKIRLFRYIIKIVYLGTWNNAHSVA